MLVTSMATHVRICGRAKNSDTLWPTDALPRRVPEPTDKAYEVRHGIKGPARLR